MQMFRVNVNSFYTVTLVFLMRPQHLIFRNEATNDAQAAARLILIACLKYFAFGFGNFEHLSVHVFCSQALTRKNNTHSSLISQS